MLIHFDVLKQSLRNYTPSFNVQQIKTVTKDVCSTSIVKVADATSATIDFPRRLVGRLPTIRGTLASLGMFVLAGAAVCLYYAIRHPRYVRVERSGEDMENIVELRRYFNRRLANLEARLGPERQNTHRRIANERRIIESSVMAYFDQHKIRFRDVGGSRTRGGEYNHLKHICNPTNDSADIFRNAKQPQPKFHSCGGSGGGCRFREAFPGALLCHSDYYMDRDELNKIIRGPTFIITGRYGEADEGVNLEQRWERIGCYIRATTEDGTTYQHKWNAWANEGCIVSSHGGAIYTRVYTGVTMDVYYAYPESGTYCVLDPNNLRRSDEIYKPITLTTGKQFIDEGHNYVLIDNGRKVATFRANVIHQAIMRAGLSVRDSKYMATLANYLAIRFQAEDIRLESPTDLLEVTSYLCDRHAFGYPSLQYSGYDPYSITVFTRLRRVLYAYYQHAWRRDPLGAIYPFVPAVVHVPGYIKYERQIDANVVAIQPVVQPFRPEGPDSNASSYYSPSSGSSGSSREHDKLVANKSTGTESQPPSTFDEPKAGGSRGGGHAGSSPVGICEYGDAGAQAGGSGAGGSREAGRCASWADDMEQTATYRFVAFPSSSGTNVAPMFILERGEGTGIRVDYLPFSIEARVYEAAVLGLPQCLFYAAHLRLEELFRHNTTKRPKFVAEVLTNLAVNPGSDYLASDRPCAYVPDPRPGNDVIGCCVHTAALSKLGKKVPTEETRAIVDGAGSCTRRWSNRHQADCAELFEDRTNRKVDGREEYLAKTGRLSGGAGAVRGGHRKKNDRPQFQRKGAEPPGAKQADGKAPKLRRVYRN